jgi:hypothetical protein
MALQKKPGGDDYARRLHNPVALDLEGRFMLPRGEEHPCRVVEMSTGEMALSTPISPDMGDRIIAYVRELGRFEGHVVSRARGGFAIGLRLTELKQRKLAGQLIWFANRDAADTPDGRRHRRIVPLVQWTRVRLPDGKEKVTKINDISVSGVSVETVADVVAGDRVVFGARTAIVGRVVEGGFVAEFENPLDEDELIETIRL